MGRAIFTDPDVLTGAAIFGAAFGAATTARSVFLGAPFKVGKTTGDRESNPVLVFLFKFRMRALAPNGFLRLTLGAPIRA